jgi:chromosome segregation ATPase
MMRERSELEHRREELTRTLPGLSEKRADAYRRNSDALALDRAGVKHEQAQEMTRLREAEVTADAAVRNAQRELRDIDAEIERMPRRPGRVRVWTRRSPT